MDDYMDRKMKGHVCLSAMKFVGNHDFVQIWLIDSRLKLCFILCS